MHLEHFIDGKWVASLSSDTMETINPATEETLATLPVGTGEDVDKAVMAAKRAFESWSTTPLQDRVSLMETVARLLQEDKDAFAALESKDTGKPLWLSQSVDIPRAISNFSFFAAHAQEMQETQTFEKDNALSFVHRHPVGVAGLITPWNLPLYLLTWKIAPALVYGNTVVAKPSEVTPLTAHRLMSLLKKAGLPDGVVNLVFGLGHTVGDALVRHPDVSLISFTGGTQTGQRIERSCAGMFKKRSLELGGKNASLVLEDADVDKTVDTLMRASFLNQGQICLCSERVLIHASTYEEIKAKLVAKTKEIVVGDPMDEKTYMGPLVSKAHQDKVLSAIAARKAGGAKLLAGDEPTNQNKGYFVRPVIMEGLSHDHACHQEEIFGPVITLESFDQTEDALARINASSFGLCANVFSSNLEHAKDLARHIHTATVWINDWLVRDLRVPFGGMKQSGVGREGGDWSMNFFTNTQTVCHRKEVS